MQRELGKVLWEDYWHLACHRCELRNPGDFIRLEILDAEIVVFNDAGNCIAFDNRCPHRGTRIFEGCHGNQAATCPYHGWTFTRGVMIIPDAQNFSHCDLSLVKLRSWEMAWVGDFLFVSKSPVRSLSDQLGSVQAILEDISFGISARADWNAAMFECDWRIAVENVLEPDHVAHVHKESLGKLSLEEGRNEFFGINSAWFAQVGSPRVAAQLAKIKRFFQLDYQFEGFSSIYLFPFTMLTSTYGYSYSIQNFFPSRFSGRTHMTSRLFTMALRPGLQEGAMAGFFQSAALLSRRVLEEDHLICARVPQESWSAHPNAFVGKSEEKILHFRRTCLDVIEGMPTTLDSLGQAEAPARP